MIARIDVTTVLAVSITLAVVVMALVGAVALLMSNRLRGGMERPMSPLEILAYRRRRGEIDSREYERLRNAVDH